MALRPKRYRAVRDFPKKIESEVARYLENHPEEQALAMTVGRNQKGMVFGVKAFSIELPAPLYWWSIILVQFEAKNTAFLIRATRKKGAYKRAIVLGIRDQLQRS